MRDLIEANVFTEPVRVVDNGDSAIAENFNPAPQALANRTRYLKEQQEALEKRLTFGGLRTTADMVMTVPGTGARVIGSWNAQTPHSSDYTPVGQGLFAPRAGSYLLDATLSVRGNDGRYAIYCRNDTVDMSFPQSWFHCVDGRDQVVRVSGIVSLAADSYIILVVEHAGASDLSFTVFSGSTFTIRAL